MNRNNPVKISNVLEKLLKKWNQQHELFHILLEKIWHKVAGERISEHTKPDRIQNNTLIIWVENSIWMNELTYLKEKIKINAKIEFSFHGLSIENIIFKIKNN